MVSSKVYSLIGEYRATFILLGDLFLKGTIMKQKFMLFYPWLPQSLDFKEQERRLEERRRKREDRRCFASGRVF